MIIDLRVPLVLAGLLGGIAIVRVAAWPLAPVELLAASNPDTRPSTVQSPQRVSAESLAKIVARDPFRIGRRPAPLSYDPVRLAQPAVPPPPRPVLALVGIVHGADATAVIEGLPGVEGLRVVRVGDVVGELRIRQIGERRVVIVGIDTTWVLEVREPWKN